MVNRKDKETKNKTTFLLLFGFIFIIIGVILKTLSINMLGTIFYSLAIICFITETIISAKN